MKRKNDYVINSRDENRSNYCNMPVNIANMPVNPVNMPVNFVNMPIKEKVIMT